MKLVRKIKEFIEHSMIVLKVTRKPTSEEFKRTAMIAGLGILLIGGIGYLVTLIFALLKY